MAFREELSAACGQQIHVVPQDEFGLGGTVWTADEERGVNIARKVEVGLPALLRHPVRRTPGGRSRVACPGRSRTGSESGVFASRGDIAHQTTHPFSQTERDS